MSRFRHSSKQRIAKRRPGQSGGRRRSRVASEAGQIVVEYVLLLAIAVIVAAIITRMMIGRDPDNPGFVLSAWRDVVQTIGADKPDDIKR